MSPEKDLFTEKAKESTGFLVWQMHNLWQRSIKKLLKKHNLTHTQFVLLATAIWLNRTEEKKITQIMIARYARTDVMMTSNVLRTLEQKKWILRTDDLEDTRAKIITPTEAGIQLAQKVIPEVEAFDQTFFGALHDHQSFNHELRMLLDW